MQQALGISIAARHARGGREGDGGGGRGLRRSRATVPTFAWPAISVGVLALAVTGAVVGVRSTASRHAANNLAATALAPALAVAPIVIEPAAPSPP